MKTEFEALHQKLDFLLLEKILEERFDESKAKIVTLHDEDNKKQRKKIVPL